jgi:prevent-host-death family protein
MSNRYSIAEARHNLAAIVHDLEQQPVVELTRRGEPVAVLLSIEAYRRLAPGATTFWEAYTAFRSAVDRAQIGSEPEIFAEVRDRSPGCEVIL